MPTRIVLSDNLWFVVEESISELIPQFESNSKTLAVNVIDGYKTSIVKNRIACFVHVTIPPIEDQINSISDERIV